MKHHIVMFTVNVKDADAFDTKLLALCDDLEVEQIAGSGVGSNQIAMIRDHLKNNWSNIISLEAFRTDTYSRVEDFAPGTGERILRRTMMHNLWHRFTWGDGYVA